MEKITIGLDTIASIKHSLDSLMVGTRYIDLCNEDKDKITDLLFDLQSHCKKVLSDIDKRDYKYIEFNKIRANKAIENASIRKKEYLASLSNSYKKKLIEDIKKANPWYEFVYCQHLDGDMLYVSDIQIDE